MKTMVTLCSGKCFLFFFFSKEEKRGEKKGRERKGDEGKGERRERKGDEGQREELTTHGDITVIIKFSGVCCVAPRTVDIAIRVPAVLKRDRHLRDAPWGGGESRCRDANLLAGVGEGVVPLLSSHLTF